MFADFIAQFANLFALGVRQVGRGCALNDLLIATLDRAVPLKQMVHATMLVSEDLHFDVAGAQDHLFEIAFAVAKGRFSLAPALQHFFFDFVLGRIGRMPRPPPPHDALSISG